jgi:hypothetical protein
MQLTEGPPLILPLVARQDLAHGVIQSARFSQTQWWFSLSPQCAPAEWNKNVNSSN